MREIKFRAWIKPYYKFDTGKKDYRMIYPHLEKDDWYVIDCKSQTLMDGEGGKISDYAMYLQQYTGLHDKNGKEIYEGDIVKWGHAREWSMENPIRIAEVKINPDIQFHSQVGVFKFGNFAYADSIDKDLEVIGNIFENPELIN